VIELVDYRLSDLEREIKVSGHEYAGMEKMIASVREEILAY